MSTDFPFTVGDKVRRATWPEGDHRTITAVGRQRFLAIGGVWGNNEQAFDQSDGPWFRYGTVPA